MGAEDIVVVYSGGVASSSVIALCFILYSVQNPLQIDILFLLFALSRKQINFRIEYRNYSCTKFNKFKRSVNAHCTRESILWMSFGLNKICIVRCGGDTETSATQYNVKQ